MVGLGDALTSRQLRLAGSVGLALLAFGLGYLVRKARQRLAERYHQAVVDLVSSLLMIAIAIATTVVIADVWNQTEALLDQLGFLHLEARTSQVVMTIVVLVAVQVVYGTLARLLDNLTTQSDALTEHQREIALRSTQLTVWVGGGVVILGLWAVDLTGLLVGAGFLGIVVGLAARKTLGSMLAGFVLMFSRPFEVGDWVIVGDQEGIVSEITTMSTRLISPTGEYVIVPNDAITSETVVNRSRQGRFRLEVDIGVDYDADLDAARELAADVATTVATESTFLQEEPAPEVLTRRFGDSAVGLRLQVWVRPPTPRNVNVARNDLVAAIKDAFDDEGVVIPFPQRELSARDGFAAVGPSSDPGGIDSSVASEDQAGQ